MAVFFTKLFSLKKYLFLIVIIAFISYGIYWLWQRQPRVHNYQQPDVYTEKSNQNSQKQLLEITPENFSVLTVENIKFQGKTIANSYLALTSNNSHKVVKINENGIFEADVKLTSGLNLIEAIQFTNNLKDVQKKTLIYWLSENTQNFVPNTQVFAGNIKNIFDILITATFEEEQKEIKIDKSTIIQLPKNIQIESTSSALEEIRIGDFITALGQVKSADDKNQIIASDVEIFRENKPQVTKKTRLLKTLSIVRQNIFSAKDEQNNIIEFTINKNSQILDQGKETDSESIIKNKNAIIIYHTGSDSLRSEAGKNIIDLIYLLP
ncbi:hypothetical protein A3F02_02905 [Candidatus Curtissbacteria bacterium RIFCSPHIGHO2_12_FULL_38_9b]|uniref:Uncharacterized protein n=2 Tax=Candidatus Curtissiibacteriota TaxID=1752717 RepID=A0A1F5GYW2_9BACT|nr:MAG: hypothetical protein A3A48_02660 [Candidatus Curtissbacteria bacterium RIFCSPLOWO2_01_FULL_37_9]OGD96985.1 MAG: hypothetical protein A3F02_02905 [Candidatus Curtissbacteria bacterium RIFCSPHIGHO2_12_FULL_38_9b]